MARPLCSKLSIVSRFSSIHLLLPSSVGKKSSYSVTIVEKTSPSLLDLPPCNRSNCGRGTIPLLCLKTEAGLLFETLCKKYLNGQIIKFNLSLRLRRCESLWGEWMHRSAFPWSTSRPDRFTSRRKSPPCPLDRRLGGPQSRSGRLEEEKFLPLPGRELRPLGRPARSQSLYRLR
jgi:hypothetical protein